MNAPTTMTLTMALLVYGVLTASATSDSQQTNDQASAVLGSCEADLTGDGRADLAIALGRARPDEVVALVAIPAGGYRAFVLSTDHGMITLSCEKGSSVRETTAGRGSGRLVKTPGFYVRVSQPEGAKAAYVWNGKAFDEVWISD